KPDLLLRLQGQRFAGAGRQMHFEPPARIYFRDDHCAFSSQRYYFGGHDVSGAQRARKLASNYDVSRANGDTDFGTNLDSGQRYFNLGFCSVQPAEHRPGIVIDGNHGSAEEVLEPCKLSEGFMCRRLQHVLGCSLTQDFAVFEADDPLTEGKHFPLRMGNVKNGNITSSVP